MATERRHAKKRNTSFPPVIDRAAVELANRDGHGVVSRLLQDLVVEKAETVIGPDWREQVSDDAKDAAA